MRPGAGVWHLESTVSGELRADVGDRDLLRATSPPGSVTGAPKVQAPRTIHQLESTARQVYCGAIGLCSPASGLELSVAIRTLEVAGRRLWLGVGGGVVSDSSPSDEVDGALDKARGVVAAAGLTLSAQPPIRRPASRSAAFPDRTQTKGCSSPFACGTAERSAQLTISPASWRAASTSACPSPTTSRRASRSGRRNSARVRSGSPSPTAARASTRESDLGRTDP